MLTFSIWHAEALFSEWDPDVFDLACVGYVAPGPRESEPTFGDQDANASSAMKDYATFEASAISESASAAISKDRSRAA